MGYVEERLWWPIQSPNAGLVLVDSAMMNVEPISVRSAIRGSVKVSGERCSSALPIRDIAVTSLDYPKLWEIHSALTAMFS